MIQSPLLLDTCAFIWLFEGTLAPSATELLTEAVRTGFVVFVSPITAWEMGILVSKGKYALSVTPHLWFNDTVTSHDIQLAPLTTDILISSSFLPGKPPRDPADRIVAATARQYGLTLVTADRLLLAYGEAGHVAVVRC